MFDPFLPIEVEKLSEKEVHSFIDYLIEKKWIQNPQGRSTQNCSTQFSLITNSERG